VSSASYTGGRPDRSDVNPMAGWKMYDLGRITVTDTLAELYIQTTSSTAISAAAEVAADRKELKYQSLHGSNTSHTFFPLVFETKCKELCFSYSTWSTSLSCTGEMRET